ncbi:amidohydrolase [Amycolatopsis rhabdoformis]|uniref:Amidohydrolase n=1 Tax=Amycolatopsis rhabdoformis TaxID=1448059 RepID=A0ABZ1HZK7_9PSEU|nr:amidohydrolase [Amycolatopsis rhabdoformis]WSE26839.1 amidohydrolase [Amycolatopsis rhabdoformis]
MTTRVFRGGRVFTADAAGTICSAVAVSGGRIAAVGGDRTVEPFLREADEVVDLAGGLLLPGFGDAHVHPVMGGLERIRCDLSGAQTAEEYTRIIGDYARAHPERDWVLGGGWAMEAFPGGRPHRAALDAVVGARPALLPNRDHHSSWASTTALAYAGIDRDTPDPADGRIERDADGEPTGLLHEGAADLVARFAPADTQEDLDAALAEAQRHLHSFGITNWQDAWVAVPGTGPNAHESYLRADHAGRLTAKVTGALWWDRSCPSAGVADQVARLAKIRAATAGQGRNYRTPSVKVMQDGVVETFTAAMLEPYLDRHGHPTGDRGLGFLEPGLLRDVTTTLDAAGFQVHFHAIGDRAVRDVLDALEATAAENGTSGLRHHLAHLQVVHPADVPRFHRLGATANLQALWAAHEPQMDELTLPFLGYPRASWQYPFGDLLRTGAALAMGSDWPVSSPDPLAAIHVAVNRALLGARTPPLGPEQALPLAAALRAYTAGSAAVNHLDAGTGSLTVGKAADLAVLDRDPFDGPRQEIGETRVVRTYADGIEVYRA